MLYKTVINYHEATEFI